MTALVVQNGNAYDEGIDNDFWKPIKAYWNDPASKEKRDALRGIPATGGDQVAVHPRGEERRVDQSGWLDL